MSFKAEDEECVPIPQCATAVRIFLDLDLPTSLHEGEYLECSDRPRVRPDTFITAPTSLRSVTVTPSVQAGHHRLYPRKIGLTGRAFLLNVYRPLLECRRLLILRALLG